jgi:hypothetical protein
VHAGAVREFLSLELPTRPARYTLKELMEFMGHSELQMRYTKLLRQPEEQDSAERINAKLALDVRGPEPDLPAGSTELKLPDEPELDHHSSTSALIRRYAALKGRLNAWTR